jgi:hypothetical protein
VYSGDTRADLCGRNGRSQVELSVPVLKIRRKNARKVAKLARALTLLDEQARTVRPAPKRVTKVSLSA